MLKKKSIFLGLVITNICLITRGCNNDKNLDLLIGEWEYSTKREESLGNHSIINSIKTIKLNILNV